MIDKWIRLHIFHSIVFSLFRITMNTYDQLANLNGTRTDWSADMRVTRMWPSILTFGGKQDFKGYNLLLVDEDVSFLTNKSNSFFRKMIRWFVSLLLLVACSTELFWHRSVENMKAPHSYLLSLISVRILLYSILDSLKNWDHTFMQEDCAWFGHTY